MCFIIICCINHAISPLLVISLFFSFITVHVLWNIEWPQVFKTLLCIESVQKSLLGHIEIKYNFYVFLLPDKDQAINFHLSKWLRSSAVIGKWMGKRLVIKIPVQTIQILYLLESIKRTNHVMGQPETYGALDIQLKSMNSLISDKELKCMTKMWKACLCEKHQFLWVNTSFR